MASSTPPIEPRGLWARAGEKVYLCGTIGAAFDQWQRARAAVSAAEAFAAQRLGLREVERVMNALEAEARAAVESSGRERLLPRRSPGYDELPLALSREIIETLDATRRIGVALTDSLLLVPSKSVTAVCDIVPAATCVTLV